MSFNGDIVVSSNYMFVSYSEGLFYIYLFLLLFIEWLVDLIMKYCIQQNTWNLILYKTKVMKSCFIFMFNEIIIIFCMLLCYSQRLIHWNCTLVLCKSIKFINNYYKLTLINFQCEVQNHESTDSKLLSLL